MKEIGSKESKLGTRAYGRITAPPKGWLDKQEQEEPIDPDLPIVDAHHHIFDRAAYPYSSGDFREDLESGHRIEETVFVECHTMYRQSGPDELRPVGETEYVAELAKARKGGNSQLAPVTGIVSYADLTLGSAVERVLVEHASVGGSLFKGIRYTTSNDPSPLMPVFNKSKSGVMQNPTWLDGLRSVAAMGLSYDALLFFHQLHELAVVADAVKDLPIVVNHCGGVLGFGPYANRRDEVFSSWKSGMKELSRRPNVSVKLGGMLIKLATVDYLNADVPPNSTDLAGYMRPYIEICIDLFGADRCMFESNFPVDKTATGYRTLWNAFKRITSEMSAEERSDLFSRTAKKIYKL